MKKQNTKTKETNSSPIKWFRSIGKSTLNHIHYSTEKKANETATDNLGNKARSRPPNAKRILCCNFNSTLIEIALNRILFCSSVLADGVGLVSVCASARVFGLAR